MKVWTLAELVVAELVELGGWGTPPVDPVWYPDYQSAALKTGGLTVLAVVPESKASHATRGGQQHGEPRCDVAVIKPFAGVQRWADGKVVVDKAEAIIDRLLGKRLDQAAPGTAWAVCMGAEHSPVISAEYARQHAIWVSYLKLTFKAGNS